MKINTKLFITLLSFILLSTACQHKKTETVVIDTWENGKPKKTMEYIIEEDGKKTAYKETSYHHNEQKFIEGTYDTKQERNGEWISWFDDGKKNSQGTYVNGELDGKYTVWYPNGNIHYTGRYKKGKQIGKWKFYSEDGNLIKETEY